MLPMTLLIWGREVGGRQVPVVERAITDRDKQVRVPQLDSAHMWNLPWKKAGTVQSGQGMIHSKQSVAGQSMEKQGCIWTAQGCLKRDRPKMEPQK